MSMNWDKLSKARSNYPRPKDALKEIIRQLKKRPNDPYYMAWQAQVHAEISDETPGSYRDGAVLGYITSILLSNPIITDVKLLAFIYEIVLDTNTLAGGQECRNVWENSAKSIANRAGRLEFYSEWFSCAIRGGDWVGARSAAQHAGRESPRLKKVAHFAMIFALQQESEENGPDKPMPGMLAHRYLTQAFANASKSPDEPTSIQDERDLRFMAQVFSRQGKGAELIDLWRNAPPALATKMEDRAVEFMQLKIKALEESYEWKEVYAVATQYIEAAVEREHHDEESPTNEPTRSWFLWSKLFEAIEAAGLLRDDKAAKLQSQLDSLPYKGREMDLVRLAMMHEFADTAMLEHCKDYWTKYRHLNNCYKDLRQYVARLNQTDQQELHSYITETTRQLAPSENASEHEQKQWLQAEINVLKFEYLLSIHCAYVPLEETMEQFVFTAIRLYKIGRRIDEESSRDVGTLAVMGLVELNYFDGGGYVEPTIRRACDFRNSRLLLQAGLLALQLAANEPVEQNRPLRMLSTRLHTMLGLPSIAYQQYQKTRTKEMLQDIASYVLLTGISILHPFEKTGLNGFSPDEELANVVRTIKRMEARTDDFIFSGLKNFSYDQSFDMLDFKDKLRHSLTKHLCMTERRRIARFKGQKVDRALTCNWKEFLEFNDARDTTVLPDFGLVDDVGRSTTDLFWEKGLPGFDWFVMRWDKIEFLCDEIYEEHQDPRIKRALSQYRMWTVEDAEKLISWCQPFEYELQEVWRNLSFFSETLRQEAPSRKMGEICTQTATTLGLANYHFPMSISFEEKSAEDDVIMPYESGLMAFFTHLELLRTTWRMCTKMRAELKKNPAKWKKSLSVENVALLERAVEALYENIMCLAQDFIAVLRQRGRRSIVAQATWGPTGKALKELISDEHLEGYAQDYVDSAIDALEGVLKVKLK